MNTYKHNKLCIFHKNNERDIKDCYSLKKKIERLNSENDIIYQEERIARLKKGRG